MVSETYVQYCFCLELYRRFRNKRSNLMCLNFNVYFCEIEPSNVQAIPFSSLAYHWGMVLNGFLFFMSSYKGLGPKKAVLANQNEAQGTFSQATFSLC